MDLDHVLSSTENTLDLPCGWNYFVHGGRELILIGMASVISEASNGNGVISWFRKRELIPLKFPRCTDIAWVLAKFVTSLDRESSLDPNFRRENSLDANLRDESHRGGPRTLGQHVYTEAALRRWYSSDEARANSPSPTNTEFDVISGADAVNSLKDASEILFYNSESDDIPLPNALTGVLRRGGRKRNTDKLTESLAAEHADENGNAKTKSAHHASGPHAPRVKTVPETLSEEEDDDFEMPGLEEVSDSDDSDSGDEDIDNDEIADLLSSKTVPARSGASSKPHTRGKSSGQKRKQSGESAAAPAAKKSTRATVEEVEDESDFPKTTQFKNPIYLFYEAVNKNAMGTTGKPGDKHYKCRHGNRKIVTVTKAMRYNVSGA
ncbi:hypothetical protein C8J57DRAFT_1478487 [Mycena rebaudengoi]|nr:hypothetical protein C8J57DRAFT_1478487 [Mycena rebaudengoi]